MHPEVFDLHGSFTYNFNGSLANGVITGAAEYYQGTILAGSVTGLYTFLAHLGLDPTFETIFRGILGGGERDRGRHWRPQPSLRGQRVYSNVEKS
jgi:hypothetical protein